MTVSWVTQVAQAPKMVGVGVERGARTHELLVAGGVFTLSLLARRDRALVRRFVKPVQDVDIDEETGRGSMNDVPVRRASTGAPFLDGAVAWIDCEVRHTLPLASHSWFVGEVVDCGAESRAPGPTGRLTSDADGGPAHGGHPHELRRLTGGQSGPGRPSGRRSMRRVRMPSTRAASASPSMA